MIVFKAHDAPVSGLFIGLTCVYVSDFFASHFVRVQTGDTPAAAADNRPALAKAVHCSPPETGPPFGAPLDMGGAARCGGGVRDEMRPSGVVCIRCAGS
jgi:hypothetical protein